MAEVDADFDEAFDSTPVIPYLGGFLSDFMMLDTASGDFTDLGLVNFEKRRKEFEVIALIKLLQVCCDKLRMQPEQGDFVDWLKSIKQLTEQQM